MSYIYATTLLLLVWSTVDSEWVSHSDNTMPRKDNRMAVGHYNGIIHLLGGFDNRQQITKYEIISDSFTFFKSAFIPNTTEVFGKAQFWTQMGCNLYILNNFDPAAIKLSVYNMTDNVFTADFVRVTATVSDSMGRACIASLDDVIYINGGVTLSEGELQSTYFLDINSMGWTVAPQMKIARRSHSCIIHPSNKVLYSVGGPTTTSIERISTVNIHANTWEYLNGSLSEPGVGGSRSFVSGNDIIIIGGLDASRNVYDWIHVIDIRDNTVRLSSARLAFQTVYSAAIMVADVLYSFGGDGLAPDGEWQSYTDTNVSLPTSIPTMSPTVPTGSMSTTEVTYPNVTSTTDAGGMRKVSGTGTDVAIVFVFLVFLFAAVGLLTVCFVWRKDKKNKFKTVDDDDEEIETDMDMDDNENVNGSMDDNAMQSGKFDYDEEKTEMPLNPQMNDN